MNTCRCVVVPPPSAARTDDVDVGARRKRRTAAAAREGATAVAIVKLLAGWRPCFLLLVPRGFSTLKSHVSRGFIYFTSSSFLRHRL
jgi:hypothetical protein